MAASSEDTKPNPKSKTGQWHLHHIPTKPDKQREFISACDALDSDRGKYVHQRIRERWPASEFPCLTAIHTFPSAFNGELEVIDKYDSIDWVPCTLAKSQESSPIAASSTSSEDRESYDERVMNQLKGKVDDGSMNVYVRAAIFLLELIIVNVKDPNKGFAAALAQYDMCYLQPDSTHPAAMVRLFHNRVGHLLVLAENYLDSPSNPENLQLLKQALKDGDKKDPIGELIEHAKAATGVIPLEDGPHALVLCAGADLNLTDETGAPRTCKRKPTAITIHGLNKSVAEECLATFRKDHLFVKAYLTGVCDNTNFPNCVKPPLTLIGSGIVPDFSHLPDFSKEDTPELKGECELSIFVSYKIDGRIADQQAWQLYRWLRSWRLMESDLYGGQFCHFTHISELSSFDITSILPKCRKSTLSTAIKAKYHEKISTLAQSSSSSDSNKIGQYFLLISCCSELQLKTAAIIRNYFERHELDLEAVAN